MKHVSSISEIAKTNSYWIGVLTFIMKSPLNMLVENKNKAVEQCICSDDLTGRIYE